MSSHARRSVITAASFLALCGVGATTPAAAGPPDNTGLTAHLAAVGNVPDGSAPGVEPTGCDLVRFLVVVNPSINKPRGHQDSADHWSWASGC